MIKNKKKRIINFLNKNGRSSTSKIAAAIRSDQWMAQKYLKELEKEGKIKCERETRGVYWISK